MFFNIYNDNRNIKEMSLEERAEYRKQKKRIRMIQVYSEIGAIALGLVIIMSLIFRAATGEKVVAQEKSETKAKTEVKVEEVVETPVDDGLKVSAKAAVDPELAAEEETTEEASTAKYFAKETESTCAIYQDVISNYGIIINNDTNEIIATKNAYDRMVPASMTKVMTVYTAWKHMKPEQLDEKVTISTEAVSACYKADCATSGFVEGEIVTVKDLFYGTILPSGGDAATQLAMYVGGDVDSFMELVNADLKELGLSDTTHFTNPIGFYDDNHYSTVYDIAMILKASLDDEFLREVLSTHVYYSTATNVNPEGIIISNWFLRRIEDRDFGGTILGAKTGYVNQSGSCAVSSEISDSGVTYICCTAKSSSSWNAIADHVAIYNAFGK